ncbi:hypothetical protein QUF90_16835 [Desulfococcaceae bacterium HSG9]|nr:hypothetical protein [Desulfococcaceae bacterium HSG9]
MNLKKGDGNRFNELTARVKAVEEIIGFDRLYYTSKGFNKKTVEKWLRKDAFPRRSSLQQFCQCGGLTIAEFEGPADAFCQALARISQTLHHQGKTPHAFEEEQIIETLRSFQKDPKKGGLMTVLNHTINAIGKKTMAKYFQQFQGYYFGYLNWTKWVCQNDDQAALKGAIFRCLIKVDALDTDFHIIRSKLTTSKYLQKKGDDKENLWAYKGVMVPIPGQLIFIFEAPDPSFEEMDFIFIMTQSRPKDRLMGIVSSASSVSDAAAIMKVQPAPAAARILLQKAPPDINEETLMKQLDRNQTTDPQIVRDITNEVHPETGILMSHFMAAGA